MPPLAAIIQALVFIAGLALVVVTLSSAVSTFVLPRSARSSITTLVFNQLRRAFRFRAYFAKTYEQRDALMAYYAPLALMLLLPVWYALLGLGYAMMYWGLGHGTPIDTLRLSGSSLFTLGFEAPKGPWTSLLAVSEAMLGLIMVALLIAYLPTMYSAFARREQAVNMLEVRAGTPPSAVEMLQRFRRIHGLDRLGDYWRTWETWFADIEESHTTLAALVFFRSPRPELSWITAAGTVLDTAALTLSAIDVPYEVSAALCIRAGYLALRRIANYFQIPNPQEPHFPEDAISISRAEFDSTLDGLRANGLPLKADREQAWQDFAGWRVNYDRTLTTLAEFVMAPYAPWSSDRMSPSSPRLGAR
jgi:hypothetical protein